MKKLFKTTADAEITVVSAITSAFPPVTGAFIPADLRNIPEFVLDASAAGATAPTNVTLFAAIPEDATIDDDVIVPTHASDLFTAAAHGLITGDGPVRLETDDTLPAELAVDTDYWIIWLSANTFSLAASLEDAFAGEVIAFGDDGAGNHTLVDTAETQKIKWREIGILRSAPTMSLRQGWMEVFDHDPRVVAYGVTWTGGTTNAMTVKISPRVEV